MIDEKEVLIVGSFKFPKTLSITYILIILYNITFQLQYTAIPYLIKHIGLSETQFGCIQTVSGVLQMIGGLLCGYVIQKFGIRFALFISYGSMCISGIGLFFAFDYQSMLFLQIPSLFMQGVLTHQILLASLTNAGKERTSAFAKMGSTLGIGYFLIPVFSISSTELFGVKAPFLVSSVFSVFLCFLVYRFVEYKKESVENPTHATIKNICYTMKLPGVFSILVKKNGPIVPFQLVMSVLSLYMIQNMHATSTNDQMIQGFIGSYIIISNYFGVIYLAKKFDEQQLLIIGSLSFLIGYILLTFIFHDFWMILLIMPFLSLGMSVVATCSDSLLTTLVDETEQGIVLGTASALNSLFRTFAPLMATNILKSYGFKYIAMIGIIGSAFSIILKLLSPIDESLIIKHKKIDDLDEKKPMAKL
ncbi:unnamed protein product [Caenorhabditis angaria]|uniref:Major facilitator superfamily (MFS) profile domain-containing protein n=1 Tax=Caenorhabditis angaria TaxID=860376 RepID=A0A9P1N2B4_9PELO|nr:unnamed protein product [Caenorhabditis angaria]